jgi:lysozyme family protein
MSTFEPAVEVVLEHEGGFTAGLHDPGGATKYGISLRFLSGLGIRVDYDRDGDVDASDVRAMPRQDAVNLYRVTWWDPGGFEAIVDQDSATKAFDTAVNMGARQANRLMLRAVGLPDAIPWLPVDAINRMDGLRFLHAFGDELARFYHQVVARRPEAERFLAGWLARAAYPWPARAAVGVA